MYVLGEDFTKPILEYDGTTISGNIAITKFITSNHGELSSPLFFSLFFPKFHHAINSTTLHIGLVGSCEEDNHASYEIVEITEDTWDKMSSMFWEKNPEKKVCV